MKKLSDFLDSGNPSLQIEGASFDSKKIRSKWAFFSFPPIEGGRSGEDFIEDAITNGASLIVCEKSPKTNALKALYGEKVPFFFCDHIRPEFSRWTAIFHDNVQDDLRIIGVTGTDGKTSCCDFLYQILSLIGKRAGLLSTVHLDDGEGLRLSPYRQTTPEADVLFDFLSSCKKNGLKTVIIEASSHGLDPILTGRLSQISFCGALYTSITSEHLDFHKSLSNYVQAKLRLASQTREDGFALYPKDCPYKDLIIKSFKGRNFQEYGLSDYEILSRELGRTIFSFEGRKIEFCYGPECFLQNAQGALKAAAILIGRPIDPEILGSLRPVPGRMDIVKTKNGTFIIDFAHTPDAYKKLFHFLKKTSPLSKLTCLMSSAGERDRTKRAKMGKIASEYSANLIITDEDPRNEGFENIARDIKEGIQNPACKVFLVPGRQKAISKAVSLSSGSDITLLLGKGHEKTIEFENGRKEPWNEKKALYEALKKEPWGQEF